MEKIPYSAARPLIAVGDVIGCQGIKFTSRVIRWFKGGYGDLSHLSKVIRDVSNEGTGRVEVLEAINKGGMQRNYLSKIYEAAHGKLFWFPMNLNKEQKKQIMELGAKIIANKIKYDHKITFGALFSPIFVDAKKFNCSEFVWYALTTVGKLMKRHNKDGKPIAPVPGDFQLWSGVEPIELDMTK